MEDNNLELNLTMKHAFRLCDFNCNLKVKNTIYQKSNLRKDGKVHDLAL